MSYRSHGAFTYNDLKGMTPWEAEVVIAEMTRIAKAEADAISGKTGKTIDLHATEE